MADGQVTIDTGLNNKRLKHDINDSVKAFDGLKQALSGIKNSISSAFSPAETGADTLKSNTEALTAEAKEYEEALQRQRAEVKRLQDSYDFYDDINTNKEANSRGIDTTQVDYGAIRRNLEKTKAKLEEAKNKLAELEAEAGRAEESISDAMDPQPVEGLKRKFSSVSGAVSKVIGLFSKMKNAAVSGMKKVGSAIGNAARKLKSFAAGRKETDRFSKAVDTLWRRLKGVAISAFLMNGISKAFSALTKYMNTVFQANGQVSASLAQIKGNLLTAFQPIYEFILPGIQALLSALAKATGYIAAFTSALFGKSVSASQKSAKALYGETNALNETGAAAKDAGKQVAAFDELNILQDPSANSGGSAPEGITPNFDTDISGFAEKVKNLFGDIDFANLGESIGLKFNEALTKFNAWIDWDGLKERAKNTVSNITTLLNNAISTIDFHMLGTTLGNFLTVGISSANEFYKNFDWSSLGSQIASGLNGIIESIDWLELGGLLANKLMSGIKSLGGFARTFNWHELGMSISGSLNSFFSTIDWAATARALSDSLRGILEFVKTFLANMDWAQLGRDIATFLSNIDWNGIIEDLAYIIGELIGGLAALLWGAIEGAVADIGNFFRERIEECGGNVVLGLLKGITDGLANIGIWLKEHILDPIVNGFKAAFGIHSPSTVFAELGGFLIEGLKQGLLNVWEAIKSGFLFIATWFNTNIIQPIAGGFSNAWKNISEWASNAKSNIKSAWNSVSSWFNDKVISPVKNFFSGMWDGLKNGAKGAWDGIKSVFSSVTGWFRDKFSQAWQAVKNVFSTGGKIFDGIKDGIVSAFKTVVNAIIHGINAVVSVPFNAINGVLGRLRSVEIMGWKPFDWVHTFNVPQIPYLAQGAVIPPNQQFMAVLGDQRHGRNLEAPEGLLRQIMQEEMRSPELLSKLNAIETAIREAKEFIMVADGAQIARVVENQQKVTDRRYRPVKVF